MSDLCTKNLDVVAPQFRSVLQKPTNGSNVNQRDIISKSQALKTNSKVKISAASFIKNNNNSKPSSEKKTTIKPTPGKQQSDIIVKSQDVEMSAHSTLQLNSDVLGKEERKPEAVIDIGMYIPKNSIQVLNEMKSNVVYQIEAISAKKFRATVNINGKTYSEHGKTESIAKQSAAESVLKDLFFDIIMNNIVNSEDDNNLQQYSQDSWKLLGSFAMFKLIEDWIIYYMNETSCNEIFNDSLPLQPPLLKVSTSNSDKNNFASAEKSSGIQTGDKKVLPNDENVVVLLNTLLGSNLDFKDMNINNNKLPFRFMLVVDNVEYIGDPASCKNEAKQKAAKRVLIKKFGYKFSDSGI